MVDASKVLPIVLIALVIISAFQALQLNSLKEKLSEGTVSIGTGSKGPAAAGAGSEGSAAASPGSGGQAAVPANIANLPSMVGGC